MKKILLDKNIVLTRSKEQAEESTFQLEKLGANVILLPTIKITEVADNFELKETIASISSYDIIIFTSENAVKFFTKRIEKINFDKDKHQFVGLGSKTTKICEEFGYKVEFQPTKFTAETLLTEINQLEIKDKKILIPCSTLSDKGKYKQLEKYGAKVDVIPFYKNEVNNKLSLKDEIEIIKNNFIDFFIFTSPSTFKSFIELFELKNANKFFKGKNVAAIGPVTEEALNSYGVKATVKPKKFTMESLILKIVKFYKNDSNKH